MLQSWSNVKPFDWLLHQPQRQRQQDCSTMDKFAYTCVAFNKPLDMSNHRQHFKQTIASSMLLYIKLYARKNQNHGTWSTIGFEIGRDRKNYGSGNVEKNWSRLFHKTSSRSIPQVEETQICASFTYSLFLQKYFSDNATRTRVCWNVHLVLKDLRTTTTLRLMMTH